MAITIIGADKAAEKAADLLPVVEVDLPHPASVPEDHRLLDRDRLASLLSHENPLVKTYALEQIAHREDEDWEQVLIGLVADADPMVSAEAIAILGRRKAKNAGDAIVKRFEGATGELAAVAATALGLIAPEKLLEAVKQRGRLDDEAYAATATSLAVIPSPDVVDFLDKALNRAGALTPERRGTLYGAALLSGNAELSARVLGSTIADSQEDEPEGSAFPTRAALGGIAGVPLQMTARAAGLELFDQSREILEKVVAPLFPEEDRKQLEQALKLKRSGEVLAALAPALEMASAKVESSDEEKQDVVEELGTMPERRRGLLAALIARADAIGKLELPAAALFVAAAVKASAIIVAGGDEASSEAVVALAKAMEGEVPSEKLARMTTAELAALFKGKSSRNMRRVLAVLTRESFRRSRTLLRFAKAAIQGGHGKDLLETMGDIKEASIQNPILDAFVASRKEAEAAIVELFAERPLNEKALPYALAVAEELRTERIGVALARRFYDLREHGRAAVARTLMRVGDPRMLPLLESRAYPDEAEEVAWAALSLVHGKPAEGRLKEALDRAMGVVAEDAPVVRLPLRCKRCHEILTYGFKRVFLDIEAKDQWGDPAFVGDVKCKACGFADDPFDPTDAATQILTSHMMEFLAATRMGRPVERPLVTPAQTSVSGRRMGFARALRELDKDIAASPDSVRSRLHRARMRLMLERPNAEEDLQAILQSDPRSVEALTLRSSLMMRRGDHAGAARDVVEVLKMLEHPEQLRMYDVDDTEVFKESLQELLVELRHMGAEVPAEMDLSAAERRMEDRARAIMEAEQERRHAVEERRREKEAPEQLELDPEVLRRTGRNDPCPCGSGRKFKKCHGS